MHPKESPAPQTIALPDIPAVTVTAGEAHILTTDGEVQTLTHAAAKSALHQKAAFVCHAPFTKKRLDLEDMLSFDVLELFAFTHPTRFCVPTPKGLCTALNLQAPESPEDAPFALIDIARALLTDLRHDPWKVRADPLKIAGVMGLRGQGWAWTPYIYTNLGHHYDPKDPPQKGAMNIWKNLPEWSESAPEPPPAHHEVTGDEARERLTRLLGHTAEQRSAQMDYATNMTGAFQPQQDPENPNVILAEAGTGIGKTLGYLAPASVWAEKNSGAVWISTYTKNLQAQIDRELSRLYPDPDLKDQKIAIRKGRENYLCLLNLEDSCAAAPTSRFASQAVAAGIMARWAAATKDGDLTGADFPGWLISLLGTANTLALADRRGECIYSACDHYHRCFVERSVRKAKRSRIVVANHALVMIQAALNPDGETTAGESLPTRYVFDEGHHLFSAADSAFAAHLTARETRDLRRWILGAEGGKASRARGLKRRLEDLVAGDSEGEAMTAAIIHHAGKLTAEGWSTRLKDGNPNGPCETFLGLVYKQVFARADGRNSPYSLETGTFSLNDDIPDAARALKAALTDLQKPMAALAAHLYKKLAADEGHMDSDTRKRLDAVATSLQRRGEMTVLAWIAMLESLTIENRPPTTHFIDWFEIERIDGRAIDTGYYRHHIDPMKPFAASMRPHLHGAVITSATLRDHDKDENSWNTAALQTGAAYLSGNLHPSHYPSPFNYAENSRIFIINDVRRDDLRQVAGAYYTLFEAAGGGCLGLFTAIQRLKTVYEQIAHPLEQDGIPLYAQHIEDIDAGSLVDIFREEEHACLLGTDAIRDGVDVPGESLRMLVFDRVPWPRPTILHKARREAFETIYDGPRGYDEMITRMKLKQAFGRLIRSKDDKGVFVMMDPMFPSRLHAAFPPDVDIVKCGLQQAKAAIRKFLEK